MARFRLKDFLVAAEMAFGQKFMDRSLTIFGVSPKAELEAGVSYDFATAISRELFVSLVYFTALETVELNNTNNRGTRVEYCSKVISGLMELAIRFLSIYCSVHVRIEWNSFSRLIVQKKVWPLGPRFCDIPGSRTN